MHYQNFNEKSQKFQTFWSVFKRLYFFFTDVKSNSISNYRSQSHYRVIQKKTKSNWTGIPIQLFLFFWTIRYPQKKIINQSFYEEKWKTSIIRLHCYFYNGNHIRVGLSALRFIAAIANGGISANDYPDTMTSRKIHFVSVKAANNAKTQRRRKSIFS